MQLSTLLATLSEGIYKHSSAIYLYCKRFQLREWDFCTRCALGCSMWAAKEIAYTEMRQLHTPRLDLSPAREDEEGLGYDNVCV